MVLDGGPGVIFPFGIFYFPLLLRQELLLVSVDGFVLSVLAKNENLIGTQIGGIAISRAHARCLTQAGMFFGPITSCSTFPYRWSRLSEHIFNPVEHLFWRGSQVTTVMSNEKHHKHHHIQRGEAFLPF
jgi:hypothetical protein